MGWKKCIEEWEEERPIVRQTIEWGSIEEASEYGQQRTLNIVHAQTAAQQQSDGSSEARMSGKCGEWRD